MTVSVQSFQIQPDCGGLGERIDVFLTEQLPGKTRSGIQKLLQEGHILVNGNQVDKNYKLRLQDTLTVDEPEPVAADAQPEDIPLPVIYQDGELLVVNKPKGMVVHPAAGNHSGTMVNALLHLCKGQLSGINGVIRPGIVHRIDKDTSGLLIVAKTDRAHLSLAAQISAHSFSRVYHAVVYGRLKTEEGTINAPIARHPTDRKRMAIREGGREAVTHYRVLERFGDFTYVECRLETGRTHQIRVHMASIGHPLAGDPLYGPKKVLTQLNGQCLHAKSIAFSHPLTKEWMDFDSSLPPEFTKFLEQLRKRAADSSL